ncbi:DMT family transporter [Fundidesulfovibrio agrisoli]|uniref:DMT family transporter n=1 Tax=Fundidesulfovibrio agrisoli TaxID=2922717 RepID=UPI001FAD526F|nr:DMT family transporter [Fundidesulfovibrio agrisoli]
MRNAFILVAFVAGALVPIQAGLNIQLRKVLGDPVQASFISFLVGTLALGVYSLAARHTWPSLTEMASTPLWLWTGGLMGAAFVTATILVGPRLGAASMTAFMLMGQLVASVVLDHYSFVGYPEHPVSWARLAGVGLLALGAWMIKAF